MEKRIEAVLFDCDGVIVNSEPLHCQAFVQVMTRAGIPFTEEDYYRFMIGFDTRGAIRNFYRHRNLPLSSEMLEKLWAAKTTAAADLIRQGAFHAHRGVVALVRRLAGEGMPLAICSGLVKDQIRSMIQALGIGDCFPVIVSAEDVKVAKPDPSGYLMAMRLLSERIARELKPADCLVIEDAPNVIRSVRQAGFRAIGVSNSHPAKDLSGANWITPSLELSDLTAAGTPLQDSPGY